MVKCRAVSIISIIIIIMVVNVVIVVTQPCTTELFYILVVEVGLHAGVVTA